MRKEFQDFPKNAKLYLISQFLLSGYYTWPFWYGFASGVITASQFGIYLAISYLTGLIAEIPTGAFADKYGRKLSAVIGAIFGILIPLTVYFGDNFTAYIIAGIFSGLSGAFVSGSLESLIRDLPEMSKDMYRRIMVHDTFFYQSGLILSSAVGGIMFSLSKPAPFVAQAISFALAAIVIKSISSDGESSSKNIGQAPSQNTGTRHYVNALSDGFLHLFKVKVIRPLIIFGCAIGVLMWLSIEYINESAMILYNIKPDSRGLLIAGAKILSLLLLNFIILRKVKTDQQKLFYLFFVTVGVFSLYSIGEKSIFLIAFLCFNLISSTQANFIKPILHDHIESKWRATAISSYSFTTNLTQAAASIVIGFLLQNYGVIFVQRSMLLFFVLIGLPSLLLFLNNKKSKLSS